MRESSDGWLVSWRFFVSACPFIPPRCGFSLSLFCICQLDIAKLRGQAPWEPPSDLHTAHPAMPCRLRKAVACSCVPTQRLHGLELRCFRKARL